MQLQRGVDLGRHHCVQVLRRLAEQQPVAEHGRQVEYSSEGVGRIDPVQDPL